MPFKMVHTHRGFAKRGSQRAGHARADQQGPRQTRSARVGDNVYPGQRSVCLVQDCLRQWQHAPDVVAAGQFRHHPAVGLVHIDLAEKRVGQQARHAIAASVNKRDTGFITTRFKSQYKHGSKCSHRTLARLAAGHGQGMRYAMAFAHGLREPPLA